MENIIPIKQTIPIEKILKVSENVNEFVENFQDSLSPFIIKNIKKQQKLREIEETYYQNQLKINTLKKQEIITNSQYRYLKMRGTVLKYWDKMRQKKWFEKILSGFKALAEKGSNLFFDILKFFLMMSLIPGLADMFFGILDMIIQFAVRLLIKYLPMVIKELKRIVFEVMPKFIDKLGNGIADAFNVPEDSPIRKIIKFLSDNASTLFIVWGVISALVKFAPVILMIFKVFSFIATVIGWLWTAVVWIGQALWSVFLIIGFIAGIPAWLVALIVGAIVAIGVAIYVFRKEIWEFITKTIPSYFTKLVNIVKQRLKFLIIVFTLAIKLMWVTIKVWFKKIVSAIIDPIKSAWATIKNTFGKLSSIISFEGIKTSLINAIKNLPQYLLGAFDSLGGAIKRKIEELAPLFLSLFYRIQARLSALTEVGGTRASQASYIASYGTSVKGLDNLNQDQVEDYIRGKKGIETVKGGTNIGTKKILDELKAIYEATNDNNSYDDLLKLLDDRLVKNQSPNISVKVERKQERKQ